MAKAFTSATAQLTREYGIEVGRWSQYAGAGDLPFGAMWCVLPSGGVAHEDRHPEIELTIVVEGDAEVKTEDVTVPAPAGTAVLLRSDERHVVRNRSGDRPLVLLSLYWLPAEEGIDDEVGDDR